MARNMFETAVNVLVDNCHFFSVPLPNVEVFGLGGFGVQ